MEVATDNLLNAYQTKRLVKHSETMETTTEPPTESPTDAPERLFQVTSTVTLREEIDGRTRRYDGVPVVWHMHRSPEETPFDTAQAVEESDPYSATFLFSREEALCFLDDLMEEWPEGDHRLESVPTPVPASDISEYTRIRDRASFQLEIDVEDVCGHPDLRKATREGWEDGDTLLVETTLELPVELAERLDKKLDVAEYLKKLEETAEAVSEAPDPNSVGGDLPF